MKRLWVCTGDGSIPGFSVYDRDRTDPLNGIVCAEVGVLERGLRDLAAISRLYKWLTSEPLPMPPP